MKAARTHAGTGSSAPALPFQHTATATDSRLRCAVEEAIPPRADRAWRVGVRQMMRRQRRFGPARRIHPPVESRWRTPPPARWNRFLPSADRTHAGIRPHANPSAVKRRHARRESPRPQSLAIKRRAQRERPSRLLPGRLGRRVSASPAVAQAVGSCSSPRRWSSLDCRLAGLGAPDSYRIRISCSDIDAEAPPDGAGASPRPKRARRNDSGMELPAGRVSCPANAGQRDKGPAPVWIAYARCSRRPKAPRA